MFHGPFTCIIGGITTWKTQGSFTIIGRKHMVRGSPKKNKSSGRSLKNLNLARVSSILKCLLLLGHDKKNQRFFLFKTQQSTVVRMEPSCHL